jgi:phenylalanyl-tRNA synthetase beta chain
MLAMRGLMETCTWSFTAENYAVQFGWSDAALKLVNPISAELDTMRPSLLPNLIDAAKRNVARSQRSVALFELGLQFSGIGTDKQHLMASGIRCGIHTEKTPLQSERAADTFDAKADVIAAIEATGFDAPALQIVTPAAAWYHPGRSGSLKLGKQIIAHFGELHPALLQEMDAPERITAFEVFVDCIPLPKKKTTTRPALEVSDYQPVDRDFAFVVDEKLAAGELLRSVKASEKTLIRNLQLFDVYQGKGVENGKKSLALTVTLQAADHTLSDAEIETVSKKIIESAGKLGAVLRA